MRLRRWESLPFALRIRLLAMCLRVTKFLGALSVRTLHSSSRKTMSMTQCRLFSTDQWSRIMGPTSEGDVVAGFLFGPVGEFARALDDEDAGQPRPIVALLEPRHIVDCGIFAGFNPAMVAIDGAMGRDGRIFEIP